MTVGLGYHNLDVGDQYTLRRTVIEVVVHPDYVRKLPKISRLILVLVYSLVE